MDKRIGYTALWNSCTRIWFWSRTKSIITVLLLFQRGADLIWWHICSLDRITAENKVHTKSCCTILLLSSLPEFSWYGTTEKRNLQEKYESCLQKLTRWSELASSLPWGHDPIYTVCIMKWWDGGQFSEQMQLDGISLIHACGHGLCAFKAYISPTRSSYFPSEVLLD